MWNRLPALLAVCFVSLAPSVVVAQEEGVTGPDAEPGEIDEGVDLIEEGAKLLLRGLTKQIEPMMDDLATEMEPKLRAFAEDFMPMLEEFSDMIGDLDMYHPPEKLPNGDIILRRKTPQDLSAPETGEVDL